MRSRDCTRRPVIVRPLWIFFGLVSLVPAQGTQPAPAGDPPPAVRQVPQPAAADQAAEVQAPDARAPDAKAAARGEGEAAKAGKMALGTLLADGKVRCWPTDISPTYEDAFAKGTVVGVGRSEGGFRQVVLPLGPAGYVHKKYASEPKDGGPKDGAAKDGAAKDGKVADGKIVNGKIVTRGKAVAFRYRPKADEPPVKTLTEGTELFVLGEQDNWWRVRNPAIECWLPEADVQAFENPPETMAKAWAELQKTQGGEVQAWVAAVEKKKEEARLDDERSQQLLALQEQFGKELEKPLGQQGLDALAVATEELLQGLPENSAVRPGATTLKERIARQKWVVEATAVRDAVPVPIKDLPQPTPDVRDPLERFQAVGFLRWEKPLAGPGQFVIEKGGARMYVVTCNSGRYDLPLFVDREVGLIGSRRHTEGLRVLDVERIEVLAALSSR
jgi:hypothetical protein